MPVCDTGGAIFFPVVLDMVPYLDKGGHGVLAFGGIAERGVVIMSCDVYPGFGRLWRSEPGPPDPVPLTEESPLRSRPAPDTGSGEVAYDNIDVEKAVGGGPLSVTILRLPGLLVVEGRSRTSLARRTRGTDFDAARQAARRVMQQVDDHLRHVLRRQLPVGAGPITGA
jgi:hypothetical protein